LQEWYRVLKPDGILRLAVPNFRAMVELYLSEEYPIENFLGPLYGKMKMGRDMIYHKTTYDWNSLFNLLKKIEFSEIRKYNWEDYQVHVENDDHSQAYIPHMDKKNGKLISLNIEAIK
jgi:predicted SAM-dependent methyltransferase